VALCGLFMRVVMVLANAIISTRASQGLTWRLDHASWHEIKEMVKPAASFMLFPLANAVSFQGTTLLVGGLLGPATLVVFNTHRTVARIAVQVTGILSYALWGEFSALFGKGGAQAVAPVYWRSARIGIAFSVGLSVLLYFMSPTLLRLWTHGAIACHPVMMALMLIYAAISGVWHIPRVLLMSTNQHVHLAQWLLGLSIAGFGLADLFGHLGWGVNGITSGLIVAELATAVVCLYLTQIMLSKPHHQ